MKNLLLFAILVAAGWYGWTHKDQLFRRQPGHEVVVQNTTGRTIERLRITVDGQTFVRESLADEARASFPFKVANDATFELNWQYQGQPGELVWKGGNVPRGPMLQRHMITIDHDGGVFYRPEQKLSSVP